MASNKHDPGDAVPEGVAVEEPVPLSDEDRAVKRKLEKLGSDGESNEAEPPAQLERRGNRH